MIAQQAGSAKHELRFSLLFVKQVGFPDGSDGNLPGMQETRGWSLG